ncbi:MAG: TonB-dependent receptor [Muribaculaceae bacterium]|nr:TonB-dependent receptor [Muribaculaceae bacterium]
MRKKMNGVAAALMLACGLSAAAQEAPQGDDVRTDSVTLADLIVTATRADGSTPVAYTNINARQLDAVNHGLDLPLLLVTTPGLLVTSDAGNGLGYTSMRIRGTDATRINVTVNDIPMNDAESHSIYWVNTPDLASSLGSVQVQRGVGTSTNGAGAFGGSVNMVTRAPRTEAYGELSGSYGSFKTHKVTLKAGTGLLGNHWSVDARLSHLASDGYRDRASAKLQSYLGQLAYRNDGTGTLVRFVTFGGKEDTYHAWDGISREQLSTDRTYNPNGEIKHDGKVTGFYDDQKDIYNQRHYQLLLDQRLGERWHLNVGLHYTAGNGYYQEYKNARTLKEYLLQPIETSEGMVKKSSLVRKKAVESKFGGLVAGARYRGERLSLTLGGAVNRYTNDHYGRVLWVENYTAPLAPEHEYYRNNGRKTDLNIYAKGNYMIVGGLSAYADLQLRHINYRITGDNDKWDWTASPEHLQVLDVDEKFTFFNPKVGLNWTRGGHRAYASVGVAHKEPTRNNYTDGLFLERPRAERLTDLEVGYEWTGSAFNAGVNLYYMTYRDQLVLNGRLNEIGEPMAENVPDSYRMGVELTAGWRITSWLRWDVNAVLSRNRINDYVAYVSDYDADSWDDMYTQTAINMGQTPIAFSPSVIAGTVISAAVKGFSAQLEGQWVSRQYLDNTGSKEDSLDPYFVSNLHLNYRLPKIPHVKEITVGVSVFNLFNKKYETNGYSQTAALYPGGDKTKGYTLSRDPRFYPMAGINALAHLTVRF